MLQKLVVSLTISQLVKKQNYINTNEYNPGKSNPFEPVSASAGDGNVEDGSGNSSSTPIGNNKPGNSGGSLFESGASK